jgi:hypothetical protein
MTATAPNQNVISLALPIVVRECPACARPIGIGVRYSGPSCQCYPEANGDFTADRGARISDSRIIRQIVRHKETPRALREFSRLCCGLSDYSYWYALGSLWVSYTEWSDLELWKRLLRSQRPRRLDIMRPSEQEALGMLPAVVPTYRAHRPGETDWISYTLEARTAARFARKREVPSITLYHLQRRDIAALFLRRDEDEVLMLNPHRARRIREIPVLNPPG